MFAIRATKIHKEFSIFKTPSDRLRALFGFGGGTRRLRISALADVSFDLPIGQPMAVIGRNGSGKTTLLKILSGEIIQTSGEVVISGTVKLLRLGVGLDYESTGISNIRTMLSLQGFPVEERQEIIDEIAEFSELGHFLEYPVRTYSSGMQSRLAFAMALRQNFDTLLIDEVLAVGDSAFTAKCFVAIEELCKSGKTVVIVTHDGESVKRLCNFAIWLEEGKIVSSGLPKEVVNDYERFAFHRSEAEEESNYFLDEKHLETKQKDTVYGLGGVHLNQVEVQNMAGESISTIGSFQNIRLSLDFTLDAEMEAMQIGFVFYDWMGLAAFHLNNDISGTPTEKLSAGRHICHFKFKSPGLRDGTYNLHVGFQDYLEKEKLYLGQDAVLDLQVNNQFSGEAQGGYAIIEQSKFEFVNC